MRFLYGLLLGILASLIAAILYLALGGGDVLLVLSPKYQEMKSRLDSLQKAAEQRDHLAGKLEDLETKFSDLTRRFSEMQAGRPTAAATPAGGTSAAVPTEAPATGP
jgi:hypothetical protein